MKGRLRRRRTSEHVFVVDVEGRAGLATARGLHQTGYTVTGTASTRFAPGHWSRSCTYRLVLADPYLRAESFLDGLAQALERQLVAALLPTTDLALELISRDRHRLPTGVAIGLPAHEVVERWLDKRSLEDAAEPFGLAPPPSIACAGGAALLAAARELRYPVVLKPARSVVRVGDHLIRQGAVFVNDERSARAAAARLGEHVLVQRFEPNARIVAVGGVVTTDGVVASVAARWERRWPPLDGATSFCETVTLPAGLLKRVEGVLQALGHVGIFELELLERRDGTFAALDLNPRPFGWMTLALRAGANLPAIWCAAVLGREPPRFSVRTGDRYRWEDGDLKHLVWQLRRGRLRAAAAVLRPRSRVAHAYLELTDPAPLLAAFLYLVRRRHVHRPRTKT